MGEVIYLHKKREEKKTEELVKKTDAVEALLTAFRLNQKSEDRLERERIRDNARVKRSYRLGSKDDAE